MVSRVLYLAATLCLTLQVHAVSPHADGGVVGIEDANINDQLSALFDDDNQDLGETGPGTSEAELGDTNQAPPLGSQNSEKHVSYEFKKAKQDAQTVLGESPGLAKVKAGTPMNRAGRMIQLGSLLESIAGKHLSHETTAVSSLKDALETKLLMDELKPGDGSFARPKSQEELGEDSLSPKHETFKKLLLSKKKDMAAITKYLLERKKEGTPLTSHEDDELQKFYYNRASTILKKIVLLKRGDMPPEGNFSEETQPSDEPTVTHAEQKADLEVGLARAHAQAVVERLKFDSKVATANAAYNKKMLESKERRMKAATEERRQAERQQLKAAKEKLMYDQKVANAEEHYNEALSAELLQRKQVAEAQVQKAGQQKRVADIAAAKAAREARAADKEAKEAEIEAEEATKHAEELEEKELEKQKQHIKNAHRMRGNVKPVHKDKPVRIPLTVIPHTHLQSLLRYLRSALNKKLSITPQEQELMQSFFLKRGSDLLSQLAQVDPDATWHSRGVMREEQYEMDREHPDQLSKEWGSKNLKGDTVVTDFVKDALWSHQSTTKLARPGVQQMVGLFGMKHKVPLSFAPDSSPKQEGEPDLGESDLGESAGVSEMQEARQGALSTMMGLD